VQRVGPVVVGSRDVSPDADALFVKKLFCSGDGVDSWG